MAFSRHNIEKRRLIELVRINPILWDCRLPHYKRSDKKKAVKWNELGRIFNVNGERVQRTFTSLREIFRRELNHEKMLGTSRFKSKWEYYDSMSFLKEVIRERKSRERMKHERISVLTTNNNNTNSVGRNNSNNNSSTTILDEYQYFAPSDPNNPNNQPFSVGTSQTLGETVPNLSLTLNQLPNALQQQAQHLQALQLQPDITLTSRKQTDVSPSHVLSSSRSCSSSPSIYIKDEPGSPDSISQKKSKKMATIRPQTKQQLKARLQLPTQPQLIINVNNDILDAEAGDIDEDIDGFDEDEDATGRCSPVVELMSPGRQLSPGSSYTEEEGQTGRSNDRQLPRHLPNPRELLYAKFGDFLTARLNTLQETVANELMNSILLLIAQK
ncbi:hypothetical protein KR018_005506 [Drosophila ironensis]|nr:hypothetical protein KR018_005506 [Drosophila ironensis]